MGRFQVFKLVFLIPEEYRYGYKYYDLVEALLKIILIIKRCKSNNFQFKNVCINISIMVRSHLREIINMSVQFRKVCLKFIQRTKKVGLF